MRLAIFTLLSLLLTGQVCGQKFLQLEKTHSPKTRKYYPGHEITFQLRGGQWYTRTIEDVSYDQKLIMFPKDHVHVDSITAFKTFDNQKWSRPIGNQLMNFAIAWTVFTLVADAVSNDPNDDYTRRDAIIAGTSALTGFSLKRLFRQRTFKMTRNKAGEARRWRLRVLDLDIKPEKP